MHTITHPIDQIRATYITMAREARYRPAAPGDGCGNVHTPGTDQNIASEAAEYAADWWAHEDDQIEDYSGMDYFLGYPDALDRPALIYIIEAARNLNGQNHAVAARLLRMALREIEADK